MDTHLGWAAGLFDGEGTIGVIRQAAVSKRTGLRTASHYIQIAVFGIHEPSLKRFKEIVGEGRIYLVTPKKGNTYFAWHASTAMAVRVLTQLQPFIFTKAAQVALAMEAAALNATHKPGRVITEMDAGRLTDIATEIRQLNHQR